jgi:hypothetical protein
MPPRTKSVTPQFSPGPEPLPRTRRPESERTVPKSYTVPFSAVVAIRRATIEYGSQGRVLQVGSELLSRLTKKFSVPSYDPLTWVRVTYKLVPRTVRLINELAVEYGDGGRAIVACVEALKKKKID